MTEESSPWASHCPGAAFCFVQRSAPAFWLFSEPEFSLGGDVDLLSFERCDAWSAKRSALSRSS